MTLVNNNLNDKEYQNILYNVVNDKNMRAIYMALTETSTCTAKTLDNIGVRRIWFQSYQYTEDNQNYNWANVSLRWAEDFKLWLTISSATDKFKFKLNKFQVDNLMTIVRMPRVFFSEKHINYLKDISIEDYRLKDWKLYIDAADGEKLFKESKQNDVFQTKSGAIGLRVDQHRFLIGSKLIRIKIQTKDNKSILIDN